ncbi:hypothetical protein B5X24_HaOG200887 [Helicoverpa armigera]|uniref:Gustatory receptor n=1 Tax=Helicoverpa armigera TaxID=29058 RepID=A0A2W1B9Y3_HELAM|nr:hypothetical protein B5X24_HaOG200887 [Helicoverpa armigera]
MTDDTLVCDIKNVLFIRFAFGFRQNFNGSSKIKRLSYLYTIFFSLLFTALTLFSNDLSYHSLSYLILALTEYFVLFTVSFLTKDEYIQRNFKLIYGLDTLPGAKKIFQNLEYFLKVSFVLGLANILFFATMICFRISGLCSIANLLSFFYILLHRLACDLGDYVLIMFIGLLYSRVKLLRNYLVTKSANTAWDRYSVKQFINMYESLANTIHDSAAPVKVTVCFSMYSSSLELSIN